MNVNFKVIFMKKQLFFCSLALASSLTAMAEGGDPVMDLSQLSNDKCYTIAPADGARGTWTYSSAYPDQLVSTLYTSEEVSTSNSNQQFAFLKSNSGKYYIYSVGGGKFLYYANNNLVGLSASVTSVAYEANVIQSTHDNAANFPWVAALNGGTQQMNVSSQYGIDDLGQPGVVFYNYSGDPGNAISITEAGDFNPTAALEIINHYETSNTPENQALVEEAAAYLNVPKNAVGGYDPALWQALYDECGGDGVDVTDVDDEFKDALTALKNSQPRPTAFSNDKVYKLQGYVSGSGYLCFENGSDENSNYVYSSTKIEKQGLTQLENSANWQIYTVGDKVLLYNQGKQSFVKYDQGENKWVATDEPVYIDFKNFSTAVFGIQDLETLSGNSYININNGDGFPTGVLGYTCSQTTTGSHFYVIEVSDAEVTNLEELAVNKAKKNIKLVVESYDESKANCVGSYSEESITALKKVYDDSNATISDIEEALTNAANSIKQVEAGKYYTILNTMPFTDGGVKAIYENPDGTNVAWHTTEGTAAELWQLESAGDDLYYLKSVNTGKYINKPMGTDGAATMKEEGTTFSLSEQSYCSFGLVHEESGDKVTLSLSNSDSWGYLPNGSEESGKYLHSYNAYYEDIDGNTVMRPNQWNIVEATSVKLTIGKTGYATAYFPFAVTIPEGVKAYTVSAAADGVATLSPLTGTIPANTGVILSGDAKTYPFAITTSTASAVEDNLLNGVTIATDLDPETSYILANGANGLGFYKVDPTDTKLAANKAYLIVDDAAEPSAVFSLKLDGGLTGIEGVENVAGKAPAYDLQGRRLPQVPTKGLYIQNGKKIMK